MASHGKRDFADVSALPIARRGHGPGRSGRALRHHQRGTGEGRSEDEEEARVAAEVRAGAAKTLRGGSDEGPGARAGRRPRDAGRLADTHRPREPQGGTRPCGPPRTADLRTARGETCGVSSHFGCRRFVTATTETHAVRMEGGRRTEGDAGRARRRRSGFFLPCASRQLPSPWPPRRGREPGGRGNLSLLLQASPWRSDPSSPSDFLLSTPHCSHDLPSFF